MSPTYCWHKVNNGRIVEEEIYVPAMQQLHTEGTISTTIRSTNKAQRMYVNYRTLITFFVIVTVTIAISSVFYAIHAFDKNTEPHDDSVGLKGRYPKALFISDDDKLWAYDPTTKESTLLLKERAPVITFDLYANAMLFYTAENTTTFHSSSKKQPGVDHIKKWRPQAVAVDHLTDKLYVVDKSAGTLNVIDIKNKRHNVIISDLNRPHDLALDPNRALVFVVQHSQSIIRGSMDGNMLKVIIKDARCSVITLDRSEQKIYWGNDFNSIEVSNYDGQYRRQLVQASINIQSLAIFDNKLYWTWPAYWVKNATLWSCDIGANGDCVNQTVHSSAIEKPNLIKTYADLEHRTSKADVCKNNAGCQHLCLLSAASSTGQSCACNLGWQLNPDGKTCIHITDFILYVQDEFIRGRTLNDRSSSFTDVIYPIQLSFDPLKNKKALYFDYDLRRDYLYFSDDRSIYRSNIMQDGSQVRLFSSSEDDLVKDVAFDWLSNNLYFSLATKQDRNEHRIMLMSLDKPEIVKTIKTFPFSKYHLEGCPYGLTVHPSRGYLFYSRNDAESDVKRINLNGQNKQLMLDLQEFNEFARLAVDLDEDVLYMISQSSNKKTDISVTSFDGTIVRSIELYGGLEHASAIYPYKDWLFIGSSSGIVRHSKAIVMQSIRMIPKSDELDFSKHKIHGMKIFSPHLQYTARENPCARNNGGCQQICFAAPDKSCGCQDRMNLDIGGVCRNGTKT